MFRFSSGLKMNSGIGIDGKGYIMYEGTENSAISNEGNWHQEGTSDKSRIWWSNNIGKLTTFKKSLDDSIFNLLSSDLINIDHSQIHPAIGNGAKQEALRLFPQISKEANDDFIAFIDFLNTEFNLQDNFADTTNYTAYSEDIGPCMISRIDGEYVLPPEIPIIFSAPPLWAQLTWWINNHFSGPYPEDPINFPKLNGKRFNWGHLKISNDYKNELTEGLVYFLMVKFIIIHDAWAENTASDSLRVTIDLIQNKGKRPWRDLY
ncbi:hypothetical protein N9242_03495 [Vicingaceae bacterium]|nr:hypothetical protein [Vicingaceae bacterium]